MFLRVGLLDVFTVGTLCRLRSFSKGMSSVRVMKEADVYEDDQDALYR
jgi:hypothetical protein